jgi:DNA repair protein RadC
MKDNSIPQSSYPRERLLQYGPEALSNQELLAILLRTGSHPLNVIELAGQILNEFEDLYEMKHVTLDELQEIRGVGQIKAIELKAMVELGVRIQRAAQPKYGRIHSSVDIATQMMEELKDYQQEHLLCLYLNTKNEIIRKKTLFIGSLNQSIAHPREIYHGAVKCCAARVICVHNHPSGSPTPSQADITFTKRLMKCGELMGIDLLDHLIIGNDSYISLREEGLWDA